MIVTLCHIINGDDGFEFQFKEEEIIFDLKVGGSNKFSRSKIFHLHSLL